VLLVDVLILLSGIIALDLLARGPFPEVLEDPPHDCRKKSKTLTGGDSGLWWRLTSAIAVFESMHGRLCPAPQPEWIMSPNSVMFMDSPFDIACSIVVSRVVVALGEGRP